MAAVMAGSEGSVSADGRRGQGAAHGAPDRNGRRSGNRLPGLRRPGSGAAGLSACLSHGTVAKLQRMRTRDGVMLVVVEPAWLRVTGAPLTCFSQQGSRAFVVWSTKDGTMPRHLRLSYHQGAARETITQAQRLQLLRDL